MNFPRGDLIFSVGYCIMVSMIRERMYTVKKLFLTGVLLLTLAMLVGCIPAFSVATKEAVIEGVMMEAGERTVTTCRKEDKSLVVYDGSFVSVRKKHKLLNIPILRGVVNFVEMMILSVKTLSNSADPGKNPDIHRQHLPDPDPLCTECSRDRGRNHK